MLRPILWLLGLALVLAAAWVHGLTATAGDSMATLYALWLFVPAPVVYLWQGLQPWRNPWRRLGRGYLGLSLALSLAVLGGVGWIGSERTIHPKPSADEPKLEDYALPAQRIEFTAPDGTRRVGWFIPGSDPTPSDAVAAGFIPQDGSQPRIPQDGPQPRTSPRPTVLLLSGYGGSKAGMLRQANLLHERGYNTLLFDFRNRGESEGDAVTLGYYEQDEALAALAYLKTLPEVDPKRIGVLGASMGAATAIMAAAKSDDLRAVVADSPFKSAGSVVAQSFEHFISLPPFPYAPITLQFVAWRTGITPSHLVPLEVVDRISPRPLLLVHGTADTSINYEASQALYAQAREPKELWLIPDIGHTQGAQKVPEEYAARIGAFFDRWLRP
ncbi:MAG TPA: alpha/beta fold hydrolase [Dehalococcoidia bacterium]|nr:alpha/beta fold hydrolase [Dehalococcoidia bacterium]